MEYNANWSLGIDLSDGLPGNLIIDDFGDAKLFLPQGFAKEIEKMIDLNHYDRLYGSTNHGEFILLEGCTEISSKFGKDITITPKRTLIFANKEAFDAGFKKVSVSFDRLGVWLSESSVTVQLSKDEKNVLRQVNAAASPKVIWEGAIEDVKYKFVCNLSVNNNLFNEFSINSNYFLEIEFQEIRLYDETQFDVTVDIINKINDLLCMLIGEDTYINGIELQGVDYNVLVYQYGFFNECYNKKDKFNQSIDFRFLKQDFIRILEFWIHNYDNLIGSVKVVKNYYFDTGRRKRIIDIPTLIKDVCVGIESYSRNMRQIKIEDNEDVFQGMLERIFCSCHEQPDDVAWLKQKLRFANEASLRKRLKIIFAEMSNDYSFVQKYLCLENKKKLDILIDRIVKTRNFYTHFDLSTEDIIYSDVEAFNVSILLIELLRLIVLQECGVTKDTLNNYWKDSQTVLNCCGEMKFIELIPLAITSAIIQISNNLFNIITSYFRENETTYNGVIKLLVDHNISHFITIENYEKTRYGYYDKEKTIKRIFMKYNADSAEEDLKSLYGIIDSIYSKNPAHKIAIWVSDDFRGIIEQVRLHYDKISKS